MQIITLTTDYGYTDYYVAELKGALYSKAKDINIVDISHSIDSYDIVQASFFISSVFEKFPENSIHILSVFNYYDEQVEHLMLKKDNHYFIAPNNGVMSLIFKDLDKGEMVVINSDSNSLAEKVSHAVAMINHGMPLVEIGIPPDNFVTKMGIQPVITSSQIRATIIHIDHYENVVVNLKKDLFEKIRNNRPFSIYYKQTEPITGLSRNYGDVDVGETMCLFNSASYMEIAVNMGKASTMYNLNKDETIQINFHDAE